MERKSRPPPASTSTRTGAVRTANSVSSCEATRRSDDAGGAATSDGASARGGAGMNEDGRGFSPCENHAAVGGPLEVTRGRERRFRFPSPEAPAARPATAPGAAPATAATATRAAVLATVFGVIFVLLRAVFGGGEVFFFRAGLVTFFGAFALFDGFLA